MILKNILSLKNIFQKRFKMKKIDLSDVTFCIPVKFDTDERMQNLDTIIEYLYNKFDTTIIIGELDQIQRGGKYDYDQRVEYYYFNDFKNYFHRTWLLNKLFKYSKTSIICNYDCDVICLDKNYLESVKLIRDDIFDIVYPHDGIFYDIKRSFIKDILQRLSVDFLLNYNHGCRNDNSLGGCYFIKNSIIKEFGGENEIFKSWGYEDLERYNRYEKVGCKIKRMEGPIFHLTHPKGIDSSKVNPYYLSNEKEWIKIQRMTKEELLKYIRSTIYIK